MQSAELLHMCNISHNCSFVDAAHKRIMPMQCVAILGHWKVLDSFLWFFSFLVANTGKWSEKWVYDCTTLKPSYFGSSGLWGADKDEICSQVILASLRWSARCSMAGGSRWRKYIWYWELVLKSLFLLNYCCEFYPHFTLMKHVTFYAFFFTTEPKISDLYL